MYWILTYWLADDYLERRELYRAEHLAMIHDAHGRGELLLAGPLADPHDRAVIVFQSEDDSLAADFARRDPYVANGVATKWTVRRWAVAVGG